MPTESPIKVTIRTAEKSFVEYLNVL